MVDVHRAGDEGAERIDLAIVETQPAAFGQRLRDRLERGAIGIECIQALVHRQDQTTLRARREAAHGFTRQGPGAGLCR